VVLGVACIEMPACVSAEGKSMAPAPSRHIKRGTSWLCFQASLNASQAGLLFSSAVPPGVSYILMA